MRKPVHLPGLNRVHPGDNVLETLDVICRQHLDKSIETLKANRPDLVNHDAISLAVACYLKPERPRPERARQRADYCHVGLVHRDRTDHDARTTFLLFVPSPGRIQINPIDAKPNNLLDAQFELMIVLESIAHSAFKFADLGQSFLIFCHLSKCVLKAEFLRLYGTKQNSVDSLNTFDLIGNTLSTQDGTRNPDTLGIANGHNLKKLSHVHTVITWLVCRK
jgi:hypothetical protein